MTGTACHQPIRLLLDVALSPPEQRLDFGARQLQVGRPAVAALDGLNPAVRHFLNRLSDHLFVLARVLNENGAGDVLWVPGANR